MIACPGAECALLVSDAADAELWWTPLAAGPPTRTAPQWDRVRHRRGRAHLAPRLLGRARPTAWEPQFRTWLPDPSAVARAIADTSHAR